MKIKFFQNLITTILNSSGNEVFSKSTCNHSWCTVLKMQFLDTWGQTYCILRFWNNVILASKQRPKEPLTKFRTLNIRVGSGLKPLKNQFIAIPKCKLKGFKPYNCLDNYFSCLKCICYSTVDLPNVFSQISFQNDFVNFVLFGQQKKTIHLDFIKQGTNFQKLTQ